ncbi:MAG TPA: ZIP family metal transporter [Thermoanaerobaculia bacterium]|nr:ZIP family metal transporter [Thermoanaerobaculia bacterium]
MPDEPVLAVLLISTIAAVFGALGALPFGLPRPPSRAMVGGAYALASGLMLGAGYLLLGRGLDRATVPVIVGAALGVAYTHWSQVYSGLVDLQVDLGAAPSVADPVEVAAPELGYKVLLQYALHSAAEGVAIGVAMVLELRLGIFLALALAVHNVAESMALTEILRRRGIAVSAAAGLCVVAKITQPVLALAAFALAPVMTALLPGALGFAAGCMVFLVLTELLPASYRRASRLPVGLLVSVAAGALLMLEHVFVAAGD